MIRSLVGRGFWALTLAGLQLVVVTASTASAAAPATGSLLVSPTKVETGKDNDANFFGYTDKSFTITITSAGCSIHAIAEAVVEDGTSGGVTKTNNGDCELRISAPAGPECEQGATLKITVRAVHTITFGVNLPGDKITASASFAGSTTSLDKNTALDVTVQHSNAAAAGEVTTIRERDKHIEKHLGGGPFSVDRESNTHTKWVQTVNVGNALTDAKIVEKDPEKIISLPCGGQTTLPGHSTAVMSLSASVLDKETEDFKVTAEGTINNKFSISDIQYARSGSGSGSEAAMSLDDPVLIPGEQHLLVGTPRSLDKHLSSLATQWLVVMPGNETGVSVQLSSSKPKVAKPVQSNVTIPAGVGAAEFQVKALKPGKASIEATFAGGTTTAADLKVSELADHRTTRISRAGVGPVVLVEGTSDVVTLSRRAYAGISSEKLKVDVSGPGEVALGPDPKFGRNDVSAVFDVTGVAPGTGDIIARPAGSKKNIVIPFEVVPASSVTLTPQEGFTMDDSTTVPLSLILSDDLPSDEMVTLASSNGGLVQTSPSSLTIPRGSRVAGYELQAVGKGTATITVTTASGATDSFDVSVI